MGHAFNCQMSLTYSPIDRSLLNMPMDAAPATDRRHHSRSSAYTASTAACWRKNPGKSWAIR